MKKLFSLIWLQIKLRIGLPSLRHLRKEKLGLQKMLGFALLALVLLGIVLGGYVLLLTVLMETAIALGFAETLFTLLYLFGLLLVLFFGILYCVSMYFAKDHAFLSTLPIPRHYVFLCKFVPALLGELATFLLIALPPAVVYGIYAQAEFAFYLRMLVPTLLLPILPFVVANILAALLMGVSSLARHKDKIILVGSIVFMVAILAGQQFLNMAMQNMTSQDIIGFLQSGFAEAIGQYVPPAFWAAHFAVSGDLAAGGWLLLTAVAALVLCVLISGRLFVKGALSQSEGLKKYKKIDVAQAAQKTGSQGKALFLREWHTLLRSPVYVMNGLTSILVGPLMVIVLRFVNLSEASLGVDLETVLGGDNTLLVAIGALYTFLLASINMGGATVYSREGGAVWILKTIPVAAGRIAKSKLFFAVSIPFLAVITTCIAMPFLFPLGITDLLLIALFAICATFATTAFGVLLDLCYPRLKWESEQKAIKSNAISAISMLAGFAYAFVLGFLGIKLMEAGCGIYLILLLASGISLAVGGGLTALLFAKAQALQTKME